jgi:hypothetical protein
MLTLVQAPRFVDAHTRPQSGRLGQLLQLGMQIAFSIGGAGRPWRVGWPCVVADKYVTFKCRQAVFLLNTDDPRLKPMPGFSRVSAAKFSQSHIAHPPASAKI